MNITIIGAGAGVGLLSVAEALENGHRVTAMSNNTSAIPNHLALTKINGSATSIGDIKKAVQGVDAILITIGTKNKKGTTLFSDMAKAVIMSMNELQSKSPVLVVSCFGVGESIKYTGFIMKMIIRVFLKDQYADKALMERLFKESSLNWEMVQPGMLSNSIITKDYQIIPVAKIGMKIGKISRVDLAHYLVSESQNPQHINRYVALSY